VRRLTLVLIALLAVETAVFALDALLPPDLSRAQRSSPVALDQRGAWLRALPVEDGRWRIRADLQRTDKTFQRRLVAVEDARFWLHPGVDPIAVVRAGRLGPGPGPGDLRRLHAHHADRPPAGAAAPQRLAPS
jgi:penicillin-binding protein 1C